MPNQTNLNVAPYFDDFDPSKDFHKVLFKPGYPVQARELTTLQSILQNQVSQFGQHFFKEGAKGIPGNISFNNTYECVLLENTFQGVPVSAYADQLVGTKITGQRSGVSAYVDKILFPEDSERGQMTLYLNYLDAGSANQRTSVFFDGEQLVCNEVIASGLLSNTTISVGAPFATTIAAQAAQTGSVFHIEAGVYFIRGSFVNIEKESLLLDQYGSFPNYRVGFFVTEDIVTSDLDESLNDNSQGFNNYAAPGADRLRVTASLFKKPLDNFDDTNFIELAKFIDGFIQSQNKKGDLGGGPGYIDWGDIIARRTFDESGNYYVKPFGLRVMNSLNDGLGNGGVFNENQVTPGGDIPSDDLALYSISPGKAYIKGYEIESIRNIYLDVDKPRTTRTLENQNIIYNTGPTLRLNRVYKAPTVGLGNTYFVSLRDQRIGSNQESNPGNEVGVARVYDFRLESGSYDANNGDLNQWDIALYDVQTTTNLFLNQEVTLSVPTFIKGANSGATGFLRSAVSAGQDITVYETTGSFVQNEPLIFDGVPNGRIAIAVTEHSLSDAKSVFVPTTVADTVFSADVVQTTKATIGIATISPTSGGVSTISSPNVLFPGDIKLNDLVQYSDTTPGLGADPIIGRVVSVGRTDIAIEGVEAVAGISSGFLPTSTLSVTDLKVLTSNLAFSDDNSLFTPLEKRNIESVDIDKSILTIRKTSTVNIVDNRLSANVEAGENETFLPFDAERYLLIRSDGVTEPLTADKFDFAADAKTLQIFGLGSNDTGATLITTLRKLKPKVKQKLKNRVNTLIVDKSIKVGSGIGTTTLNNGLTYGNYPFGTRVEDETISLNRPDVIQIHGIFESADNLEASAPKMTLQTITTQTTTVSDLVVGEQVTGQFSEAIGIVAEKLDDITISIVYLNDFTFELDETVTFAESGATAVISGMNAPSFDVSSNYKFQTGQELTFYDHGRIKRKPNTSVPSSQLKIYYSSAYHPSSDDGDVVTIDSYEGFNYTTEIKAVQYKGEGIRVSDIIDIRPRVSNYTVAEDARSPLEFLGRTFNAAGQSAANILASDEAITADISYYQGRIDRVFMTATGKVQIIYGQPSDNPQKPNAIDDALEICTIDLPPYLYFVEDASLSFLEHKRYRMKDIQVLENRLKNLEYYTSLSLLERETKDLFVPDSEGLNRFKSGFFVDNFVDFKTQELPINNSIDRTFKMLRPKHHTDSVDMIFGPVVNQDPDADVDFSIIEGINVTRSSINLVTLDYSEVEYQKQTFGTRTESVTPFILNFWDGILDLTPASDNWIDTTRLEAKIIDVEGNYTETLNNLARTENVDPQTGFGPTVWNSWQTNWTGIDVNKSTRQKTRTRWEGRYKVTEVVEESLETKVEQGIKSRDGVQVVVAEQYNPQSVGDRVVSRELVPYMRSRNIKFTAKKLLPYSQLFAFFDGVDVTKYCTPKLLEIQMDSGVFEVGETVESLSVRICGLQEENQRTVPHMSFRVAQANHREGPYNNPLKVYPENPYTKQPLPSAYSSTSTVLNIDVSSLAAQARGDFSGYVNVGTKLIGQTSKAEATVTDVRLVNDSTSTLIGSYFIPSPNSTNHPKFEAGTKTFRLTDDPNNDISLTSTAAEEAFESAGTLETLQENIISVRNAKVDRQPRAEQNSVSRNLGTQVVGTKVLSSKRQYFPPPPPPPRRQRGGGGRSGGGGGGGGRSWVLAYTRRGTTLVNTSALAQVRRSGVRTQVVRSNTNPIRSSGGRIRDYNQTCRRGRDPLAQTFRVTDDTGVFVTSFDAYFASVDDNGLPVIAQIRSVEAGVPTEYIMPFAVTSLDPEEIVTSSDGSVATNIQFPAPIYLEAEKEYALVLLSDSPKYSVYISRVGENDLTTDTFVSQQPFFGSFFKSQNGSTWEPSQWEDLKFTLFRADFLDSGMVDLYSPELTTGNEQIALLQPDSIKLESRQIRVGLGTTVADAYEIGNTFFQAETNATGNLVGTAGSATGSLTVSNPGIGYTPFSGSATFAGVDLVTLSGNGRGAQADVSIVDGLVDSATITASTNGGSGYQVGDVLGISTIGISSVGKNARLTVTGIGHTGELVLENVQGEFVVGAAKTLFFINSSGITTELNSSGAAGLGTGGDVQITSITEVSDGLHFTVNHVNHGMYFNDNIVTISGVTGDVRPTTLTVDYESGSTDGIVVASAASFTTFEGVGIGTTNPGYLKIGDEIIQYTNVNGNTLGGTITRGESPRTYAAGTPVFKYELGGVNLQRINNEHDLLNVTASDAIGYDSYKVKLDMTANTGTDRSTDIGFPKLYINQTKAAGGSVIRATQNIPYEVMTPNIQNLTLTGTNIEAEVRTVTSKSISGNEVPYVDKGFEPIVINEPNYFDSPRAIYSKQNEERKLEEIEGAKSMHMRLLFNTVDSRISPMIDGQRASVILTSNRVNNVVDNYATNQGVKTFKEDPTACQYVSKEITLENPASSIKVILSAHINEGAEVRALYSINNTAGVEPVFNLFPGYPNLDNLGRIIDSQENTGLSDRLVTKSNIEQFDNFGLDFKEYTFTMDNLPTFNNYRIKLLLTSNSQAFVPMVRDLRVIALA